MVTWHDTIFLQSKMQHRACELRDYSWFIIFLFPTYSHAFLLGLSGPCQQWGAISFALSIGQGGSPLLQVARSSRALSKGEHAPSTASQNWQPTGQIRLQQPIPRILGNPSALCLTGFIPGFNLVFIPEHAGWPNRWVSGVGVSCVPAWQCLQGSKTLIRSVMQPLSVTSCRPITASGQGMPRTFGKNKKKAVCKGLLQHYWSEKAERASLPSVHTSPPLQLFITSHSGKDNLLKILQWESHRPSLEHWLPLVPGREGLPGGRSSPGQAPRGHSAHCRSAHRVASSTCFLFS